MPGERNDISDVRPLSISELERLTSTPRSTIYYYVRDGLLPAAQKAAASRAVYSDVHVEALREIRTLKQDGVPLDEIRERIRPLVESRQAAEPDLVARRTQQTRDAILQAAALQFARRGYRRTRVGDIIREVGITPPVFYAHFTTKQQLFIEAFNVFVHWMGDLIEPPLADEPDPAVRLLMRFYAYWGLQRLSPDLLGLARAEALQEDGDDARRRAGGAALDHQRTGPRPRRPAPRLGRPARLRRAHGLQPVRRRRGDLHARLVGRRLLAARDPPRAPVPVPGRRRRLHRPVRHGGEAERATSR